MTRRRTTFLARETYRRRRLIDALRVLPVVAGLLFLVPMLGASNTAATGIYLFSAWIGVIAVSALLIRSLARAPGGVAADPLEPGSGALEDEV